MFQLDLETKAILASSTRQNLLPWGSHNRSSIAATSSTVSIDIMQTIGDNGLRPGEIVMRNLFAEFTQQAEKKIESVMLESSVFIDHLVLCRRQII